jgi:hypothetical protein
MKQEETAQESYKKIAHEISKVVFEDNIVKDFTNTTKVEEHHVTIPYLAFERLEAEEGMTNAGLKLVQLHKQLKDKSFSMTMNRTDMEDIKQKFGVDMDLMSFSALLLEAKQCVLNEWLKNATDISDVAYRKTFTRFDKFKAWLWHIFGGNYIKTNVFNDADDLLRKLTLESIRVATECRYGKANICIVGRGVAEILKGHKSFVFAEDKTMSGAFISKLGYFEQLGMTVYVNNTSEYNSNQVIVFRKAQLEQEGLHLAYSTDAQMIQICEKTMAPQKIIKIYYDFCKTDNAYKNFTKFYVEQKSHRKK